MSVRIQGDRIFLENHCGVEDAEALAAALEAVEGCVVDLSLCRHLHGAVVQALLVFHPEVEGDPMDGFLTRFVLPALAEAKADMETPSLKTDNSMETPE